MLFRAALQLALAAATGVLGLKVGDPSRRCAESDPASIEELALLGAAGPRAGASRISEGGTPQPIEVDLYFHVVSTSTDPKDGYISNSTLDKQLEVLNADFGPAGISFVHRDTTHTVNKTWALNDDDPGMKRALRRGSYRDLNVYFLTQVDGYLGFSTFPKADVAEGSDTLHLDGCVILHETVPGGAEDNYNLGRTTTHEVGHWFGLFHTFQGGCRGQGDHVADTPAEAGPADGCPVGKDSCFWSPGLDPVHNYMNYSWDSCMREFTKGQINRMRNIWYQVRD